MRLVTSSIAVSSLLVFFLACGVNLPAIPQTGSDGGDSGTPPAPKITTQSIPPALEGDDYGAALGASGGAKPLTWSVTQLPTELAWLTLQADSGVLSGPAPRQALSANLQVQVEDALARKDSVSLTLSVQPCQDGDTRSCNGETGPLCILGSRVCAQGMFGACSAPDAGQPSQDAERCGPDCSDCGLQGGDRCVGGSCVCGDAGTACAAGSTCCGDGCSDLLQPDHCHACDNDCANGRPANTDAGCGEIDCSYACASGYADCDSDLARDAGNGCEIYLPTDVNHCGSCGNDCTTATGSNHVAGETCSSGSCAVSACSGTFDDCDGTFGNGCETDLSSTENHCGSCGYDCDAHLTAHVADAGCGGSTCHVATCQTNYADCDNRWDSGCEVNLQTDPQRCGSCTNACSGPTSGPGSAICQNGSCGIKCNTGYSLCGTSCVDEKTDVNHCGSCSKVCPPPTSDAGTGTDYCSGGTCGLQCNSGYTLCGTDCSDLKTDENNCGSCGNVCPINDSCMDPFSTGYECCHIQIVGGNPNYVCP